MVDKDEVKRVFSLSKQDIYFIILIVMMGIIMAFNFSLVEPVRNIQEAIRQEQEDEIRPVLEELLRAHNYTLPDAAGAVCTVACLPQNYTHSEQQLLKLLNRTSLPFD
jgi:hypothetical protein